jgi:hypothetical protein
VLTVYCTLLHPWPASQIRDSVLDSNEMRSPRELKSSIFL